MIDLKEAKYTNICFRGKVYQYWVLLFGLSLSPRNFLKCVDAALTPWQLQGIQILNYIDETILAQMKELGLMLNAKKSVLSPA